MGVVKVSVFSCRQVRYARVMAPLETCLVPLSFPGLHRGIRALHVPSSYFALYSSRYDSHDLRDVKSEIYVGFNTLCQKQINLMNELKSLFTFLTGSNLEIVIRVLVLPVGLLGLVKYLAPLLILFYTVAGFPVDSTVSQKGSLEKDVSIPNVGQNNLASCLFFIWIQVKFES